jgi:hypothetical protein
MALHFLPGSHPSEPVRTGANQIGNWLTVAEAVAYCSLKELDRTPKTIRKWAHRSHLDPENAELTVRHEDVDNGFRWAIERASLDRKIAQELEFEARRAGEPVDTRPEASGAVRTGVGAQNNAASDANLSEPVQTGAHKPGPVRDPKRQLEDENVGGRFLKDQIGEKDRQIAQLNKQLERRDEQIMTMLERDRETNILISGLQQALTTTLGIEAPVRPSTPARADNPQEGDTGERPDDHSDVQYEQ